MTIQDDKALLNFLSDFGRVDDTSGLVTGAMNTSDKGVAKSEHGPKFWPALPHSACKAHKFKMTCRLL